jgi:hypothetical protein
MKLKIQKKVGTGQCDGCNNNVNKSVVSIMVTVKNEGSFTLQLSWLIFDGNPY